MPERSLIPHPTTPCPFVRGVTVSVDAVSSDLLVICYEVDGDIDELALPAQARSQHADELWKATCFEAFLRPPGAAAYVELNFSPSSEWAVYRFDAYRQGMTAVEAEPPPRIVCRRREDSLIADVDVHLGALGAPYQRDLEVAASTVLKDRHGNVSYWALAHPPGKPDFHHADGFALRVAAAGDSN
jgi:hypothetical protein